MQIQSINRIILQFSIAYLSKNLFSLICYTDTLSIQLVRVFLVFEALFLVARSTLGRFPRFRLRLRSGRGPFISPLNSPASF